MTWSDTFLGLLEDNDVRLTFHVPDKVFTPLLTGVTADNYVLAVGTSRDPALIRSRFMKGLGIGRGGGLEA